MANRLNGQKRQNCSILKVYKKNKIAAHDLCWFWKYFIPGTNGNQNSNDSCSNKHQNHVGCSYDFNLLCVYDQFNILFKSYLRQDVVQKFMQELYARISLCKNF